MNWLPADFGLVAAGAFLAVLVVGSAGFAFAEASPRHRWRGM